MINSKLFRFVAVGSIAITTLLSPGGVSAAIPCGDQPVIEPDPNMVIPLIYLELPRSIEEALGRGRPADRTGSVAAPDTGQVIGAAENQMRCLGYGDDVVFAGNSTPEQRVSMFAVPQINSEERGTLIKYQSVYLERLGDPIQLADGRYLIDFGIIVDGSQYLTGEFVFEDRDGILYLDGSTIFDSVELNSDWITVDLALKSTREVKRIEATEADVISFNNLEDEASASIIITDANGNVVWGGSAMGNMLVGGADIDTLVVHNLPAGEYNIVITFDQDSITYGITLIVDDSGAATPEATPAQ